MIYRVRERQMSYGRPIGIVTLDEKMPCPPGTPGNPTTFSHPVIYEVVKGADIEGLIGLNDPDSAPAFLEAAQVLVGKGVAAVTGNCGLMIVHQTALAKALPVPVLMSSLVQLPMLSAMLGPGTRIGIMASSRRNLKAEHLVLAGAGDIPIALATMDGCPHFRAGMSGEDDLDFDKVETEVAEVARSMVAEHPDIGAIVFECVDLPPYAHAVQEATGLPVYDITTLINHTLGALVRRRFTGIY